MDLTGNCGGGGVESICMHMGLASLYFFFQLIMTLKSKGGTRHNQFLL